MVHDSSDCSQEEESFYVLDPLESGELSELSLGGQQSKLLISPVTALSHSFPCHSNSPEVFFMGKKEHYYHYYWLLGQQWGGGGGGV